MFVFASLGIASAASRRLSAALVYSDAIRTPIPSEDGFELRNGRPSISGSCCCYLS